MAQTKTKAKKRSTPKRAKSSPAKSKSKASKPKATSSKAVDKAKLPLVAGGAAIAGAAGGLALAASKQSKKSKLGSVLTHKPRIKLDSKDVARAAKEVGNFSAQMGELATELQRARESGNGKRRSPVEVVLQGLTARR
jgi:uncharacterized protein HemX